MRNTFIMIPYIQGEAIRINVDHIISYFQTGGLTEIQLDGQHTILTELPATEIDQMMAELYFTVKK